MDSEHISTRAETAALRLSEAVRFETISGEDPSVVDGAIFQAFKAFLERSYPLVSEKLDREPVGEASLLHTWKGANPEARPLVLAAHSDVVPIEPGTLDDWTHPPFEGAIAGGYVWGRGTMDCKGQLIAIMEAVEWLLSEGYQPERTIHLAFGDDEEVGGHRGAEQIAALLGSRGSNPELVLDEGGVLVDLKIPGFKKSVATVGIVEKGYLTVELRAEAPGGHASMPPRHTAIGILAKAIHRLEEHPFPGRIGEATQLFVSELLPELPGYLRILLANRWLLRAFAGVASLKVNAIDAMLRTTLATTMVQGGTKDNVLPQEATATINLRIMPGESINTVMSRLNRVIDDPAVTVRIAGEASEPSRTSSVEHDGFRILDRTIKELFPDSVTAPYLVVGMTDSRHYSRISDSVFRFCPLCVTKEDQDLPHGTDERISVDNLGKLVEFYARLISNSAQP